MTKLFICTPAFEGKVHVQYAISYADTCRLLSGYNIQVVSRIVTSGSLLCAERNRLTEAFMETDCTHMLCIDSDLGWPPQAVMALLNYNEDFVAGCYPSRHDPSFIFRPEFNENNSIKTTDKNLLEMQYIPAGFMLIKRCVIEKMRECFPELYFEPKHPDSHASKGYCFFHTELRDGEFWGEDYTFCRLAKEAGFKILVDALIEFDHAGRRGALIHALTQDKDKAAANPLKEIV